MNRPSVIFQPLSMALVLALGFGTVFAVAGAWGFATWESLHSNRDDLGEQKSLVVRADGTPLIRCIVNNGNGYQSAKTYRTLDGSELPSHSSGEDFLSSADLPIGQLHHEHEEVSFPLDGYHRIWRFADGQTPASLWYFVHDGARDGRGYFVGYNTENNLCVGFIGRAGFRAELPPVEDWFPVDGAKLAIGNVFAGYSYPGYYRRSGVEFPSFKVIMISGNQVVDVDLWNRSVTTLLESDDLIALDMLQTAATLKGVADKSADRHDLQERLAIRTADRVLIFDAPGKKYSTIVIPEELRERDFSFYEIDAGTVIVTVDRKFPDDRHGAELFWIDASGKISRRAEVPLGEGGSRNETSEAWAVAAFAPSPVAIAFEAYTLSSQYVSQGRAKTYAAALARSLAVCWPMFLVVTLLAAALAFYCFRRHRRYYQPYSGLWFAFVLLLGLPGLVGYLFHRHWPVLEKCPLCGHAVPRDRETCAACARAFPPPAPRGCEVFAP